MLPIDHFAYGFITPVLAYAASCLGFGLGLLATARARAARTLVHRSTWLLVGALAMGGTGIWVMHVIGLWGFAVEGMPIYYDVPVVLLGAGIAVGATAVGLFLANTRKGGLVQLGLGGAVVGLGAAGTQYLAITAMEMTGEIQYSLPLVVASVFIAVVAATGMLWLGRHLRRWFSTLGAALAVGAAFSCMHYTALSAVTVTGSAGIPFRGTPPTDLLGPFLMVALGLAVVLTFVISMWPTEDEIRDQDDLDERIRRQKAMSRR